MADIAQLGLAIDSAPLTKATAELNRLAPAANTASKSIDGLNKSKSDSDTRQRAMEASAKRLGVSVAEVEARTRATNNTLAQHAERYKVVEQANLAASRAMSGLSGAANTLAEGLSRVHPIFGMLGGGALSLTAIVVGLAAAYHQVQEAAMALADRAGKLQDFAETTGFTVIQLQALEKAGAQVGVSANSVSMGLEKFSVAMDDAKKGIGPVYESILEINPALAKQLTTVNSLSDAWDVTSKAIKGADLEQANKLSRALFGRGGVEISRLGRASVDAGGIGGLVADMSKLDAITQEQAKRWDDLGDTINENTKAARQNIASIFTETVLTGMERFSRNFLELTREIKAFTIGEDFKKFLEWSKSPVGMAVLGGAGGGLLGLMTAGPAGAIVGGGAGAILGAARGVDYQNRPPISLGASARIDIGGGQIDAQTAAIAAQAKALDDQKRALTASIAEQERINAVMGAAVTPADNLRLGIDKLKLANLENKISAEQLAKGQSALNATYSLSRLNDEIALKGQSVTADELVLQKQKQIEEAARRGVRLTDDQIATQIRLTRENALGITQINASIDQKRAEAATIGMTEGQATAYLLVMQKVNEEKRKGLMLDPADRANLEERARLLGELVDAQNRARDLSRIATSAFDTIVDGFSNGKSSAETFIVTLNNVASSLKNIGSRSLETGLSGLLNGKGLDSFNPSSLAIGGLGIGLSLITSQIDARRKEAEEAERAAKEALDRIDGYTARAQAAVIDTNNLNDRLIQFDRDGIRQRKDELAKGGQGIVALEAALAAERKAIVDKAVKDSQQAFDALVQKAQSATQKAVATLTDATSNLATALTALGKGIDGLSGGVSIAVGKLQAEFVTGLMDKLNAASGLDYVANVAALVTQRQSDLVDAATLGINSALVEQSFQAQVQKVIDGAELTGVAFQQMLTVFPQLTGRVHEFSGVATASVSALSSFISKIEEFRKGLLLNNSLSTLSPTERYAEARQQYEQTLAGARAGDANAQNGLQAAVTAFLTESKSYNASNAQYAQDFADTQGALVDVQTAAQSQIDIARQQLAQLVELNKNVIQFTLAASAGGVISSSIGQAAGSTSAAAGVNAAAAAAQAAAEAAKTWHYPSFNPYSALGGKEGWTESAYARYRVEHPEARYQMGGLVTNGLYNQDSVSAMLAGGEFVMPAPRVTPATLPVLQDMRSGRAPSNDNGSREIGAAINRQTDVLVSENRELRESVADMKREIKSLNSKLSLVLAAA